ncbi:hypothetical protein H4Q26_005888 [Puccinia striiformis f. sp. tritici PST-130]|nr:hypothetical protein H4Q26_005888 [Puccinia striiformis f. sp. tritici PST-130]
MAGRMAGILELPNELFDQIFQHLISGTPDQRSSAVSASASNRITIASNLRLVCRTWADWLYEHHLYRTLTFGEASRAMKLTTYLRRRSQFLPRARCQHLTIRGLCVWEASEHPIEREFITCRILKRLIETFSDTIVTLVIRPLHFLVLDTRTIKAIGRISNLCDLQLEGIQWHGAESVLGLPPSDPNSWFNCLMGATQALKSLRLASFVSLRFGPQLPAITHLDIDISFARPDTIIGFAIALKATLRVLSIRGNDISRFDGCHLLEAFTHLNGTLEVLSLTAEHLIAPILDLKFEKLRVLKLHTWHYPITNYFSRVMFSYSPIEVIAMSSSIAQWVEPTFPADPFVNLHKFKTLVCMNAPLDFSPAPMIISACKAHGVQCVFLDHDDLSAIMVR